MVMMMVETAAMLMMMMMMMEFLTPYLSSKFPAKIPQVITPCRISSRCHTNSKVAVIVIVIIIIVIVIVIVIIINVITIITIVEFLRCHDDQGPGPDHDALPQVNARWDDGFVETVLRDQGLQFSHIEQLQRRETAVSFNMRN